MDSETTTPSAPTRTNALQREARALGDPTRHAIFQAVADAPEPISVGELTALFDLHHNAIRQHLAKLVDADLLTESTARSSGPGRPRLIYSVTPGAEGRFAGQSPYEQLSRLLAEVITSGDSAEVVGRRATTSLGSANASETLDQLTTAIARQGFAPEVVNGLDSATAPAAEIVLQQCPYAATAADARDTVCLLHLGIIEGLVDGTDVAVEELVARDPAHASCSLHVRQRSAPGSGNEGPKPHLTFADR